MIYSVVQPITEESREVAIKLERNDDNYSLRAIQACDNGSISNFISVPFEQNELIYTFTLPDSTHMAANFLRFIYERETGDTLVATRVATKAAAAPSIRILLATINFGAFSVQDELIPIHIAEEYIYEDKKKSEKE